MKKIVTLFALAFSVILLSSCEVSVGDSGKGLFDAPGGYYSEISVKFVIDGDSTTKKFSSDEKIVYPDVPEKENYIFSGWFYDEDGKEPAYLGTNMSDDITLYACYTYDYAVALNSISLEYIKAAVGIEVVHTKTSFGFTGSSNKVNGSGVIFDEDDRYYYVLTNCHVAEAEEGYNSRKYSVIDCYGNSHTASLLALGEDYDLAVLTFAKGNTELLALRFADEAGVVGDNVVAIGTPGGIDNNITFGKITRIKALEEGAVGYLAFDVVWHDAPMDHGSSGGVLLNDEFKIVGINYAVGTSSGGAEFVCGLSVPYEKVIEFVNSIK